MEVFAEYGNVLLRVIFSLIVLFILSKLTGVRQIAQLTFYDYIVGITVGSIAAEMSVNTDTPAMNSVIAMIVYILFSLLLSWGTTKSIVLRRFCTGKPRVMIYKGKIIEKNLRRNRYDINDLLLECRLKGFFNIDDIAYAVMETNGEVSFLPKANKRPLTPEDIKQPVKGEGLEYNLIIDGVIMERNLQAYGKNETWLNKELAAMKAKKEDVLLAVGKPDDTVQLFFKNEQFTQDIFI